MTEQPVPLTRRRSSPLPPDERRAALVAATSPLIRMHGLNVPTRLIAEAAGVAEGTIFRVFPDKNALLRAALAEIFDPAPTIRALRDIPPSCSLQVRLATAATIVAHRMAANAPVIAAMRSPEAHAVLAGDPFMGDPRAALHTIVETIADMIRPDADKLRRSPITTAQLLISMVILTSRGMVGPDHLTGGELADLLLNGLIQRSTGDDQC
ncbi:TetR/AcrR family transcriptional regulator [Luedemannella flava]|uniref:TetR/AcrR family transcriptional regulator n=1 Tax=Luedemannella flava TaxID=349316 RepID=A0ABP4Y8S5_9ACTN